MAHSSNSDYEAVHLSDLTAQPQNAPPSIHPRHTFRRHPSTHHPTEYARARVDNHDIADQYHGQPGAQDEGLGLKNVQELPQNIKRVPVGAKKSWSQSSTSPGLFLTPESSRGDFSQANTNQNTPLKPGEWDWVDKSSFNPQGGRESRQEYSSEVNLMGTRNKPSVDCPTEGDILTNPWSRFAVPILIMSFYSTIFSGIFLGIAMAKPRWGGRISTHGNMSYATATLLSALFSKTVELSFVAVFVALLGQVLSRRAIMQKTRRSPGVNVSEMTMRLWVTQPGTLLTQFHTLRYAALTVLGALTLLATVAAAFYTTAAEALASPKLKLGHNQHRQLAGLVTASFANSVYLSQTCQTPVNGVVMDSTAGGNTCLQISYAGQGYHNFQSYLADWAEIIDKGNTANTSTLAGRPPPFAMLYENTTVTGQWITPSHENITADSAKHRRLVQNITMAMPHGNVFNAVRDPKNHILQPSDLDGQGEYYVSASVPAPTINVLCVGMQDEEVTPLIYEEGGDPKHNVGPTKVDHLFGFYEEILPDAFPPPPPQFPKKPIEYNTITNATQAYGPDSVYILARPVPSVVTTNDYVLCSVKTLLYPNCTTKYHVAEYGGELSVHCNDDPDNTIAYSESQPLAPSIIFVQDWKDIGSEWQNSVALSGGLKDNNNSMARLLTQFVPTYAKGMDTVLNPYLPSVGESLGVLAGCTALMSSAFAPFIHYWNYSSVTILESPQYQYFNATVQYKDYASGGTQKWQGIFYLILVTVFAINLFSLGYLMKNFCVDGQVTDYTEPQNLFALAMMSPPSPSFSGSCGGGPSGRMLAKRWRVDMQDPCGHEQEGRGIHPHFFVKCPEDDWVDYGRVAESLRETEVRKRRRRPKSMNGWWERESPAVEQYRRLAKT